jgi:cytochrome c2
MKKLSILKTSTLITLLFVSWVITTSLYSCKASQKVSAKPGVQLWAENCQRCHNTPSPATFSPEQWETIGMHMQTRSLITNEERVKIVAFLKQ